MARLERVGQAGVSRTFYCYEGQMTEVMEAHPIGGRVEHLPVLEHPVHKGDLVSIVPKATSQGVANTPQNWTVKKANVENYQDGVIGIVMNNPEWARGYLPQSNEFPVGWGNYTPRECTVMLFGDYIDHFKVSEEIFAGDYLELDKTKTTGHVFKKSEAPTTIVALDHAPENGIVNMLFKYNPPKISE